MEFKDRMASILGQVKDLEDKMKQQQANMHELKRSLFNKFGDDMGKELIDRFDPSRLQAVLSYMEMVLHAEYITPMNIMGDTILCKLVGMDNPQSRSIFAIEWLDYWVKQGNLESKGHFARDCRHHKYSLRKEAP